MPGRFWLSRALKFKNLTPNSIFVICTSCDLDSGKIDFNFPVAQISPFTQRDFVARRMFLSHRVNELFLSRVL